jgi:hypothetical protein
MLSQPNERKYIGLYLTILAIISRQQKQLQIIIIDCTLQYLFHNQSTHTKLAEISVQSTCMNIIPNTRACATRLPVAPSTR